MRDWLSRAGLVCLALLVVLAIGSVWNVGGDPDAIVGPRMAPPSAGHLLGTDNLGRSMLPRIMEGIATTLLLSSVAVLVTATLSAVLGIVAGYRGGAVNELILRLVEVLYSFPAIVLAILVAAVVGPGQLAAQASIVLVTIPLMTRLVRAAAVGVAQRDYVTAAIISGARLPRILGRHLLPNVAGTIAVQVTYALSVGIAVEGGLSFLGFGVQPPQASLGVLIQQGGTYMIAAPWMIIGPGSVFVIAVLAINVVGDGLRDRFEPRQARALV
jgi:peptide/nickel transport system permease protein